MIEKRLNGCTFVYEEEFEVLAKTFESLQAEVVIQRDRENDLRAKLAAQEAVNTQLNNFMESVGYDLIQGDNQRSLNKVYGKDSAADIIDCVIQIQDEPDLVHKNEAHKQAEREIEDAMKYLQSGDAEGDEDDSTVVPEKMEPEEV